MKVLLIPSFQYLERTQYEILSFLNQSEFESVQNQHFQFFNH